MPTTTGHAKGVVPRLCIRTPTGGVVAHSRRLKIYRDKVRENEHGRLRSILDPEQVLWPYTRGWSQQVVGAILQTQVSLVPLFELEKDITVKACYLEAMRVNAKLAEAEPGMGGSAGLQIMLLAHKLSLVAPVECPRQQHVGDVLRKRCNEIIAKSSLHSHDAAANFWTAVRKGLFRLS